ncbi:hypothetical protein [Companilactobacillus ginsenosidimutans]|uniref:BIG2 domain-containing protein n=1 Tax=Companilactobacillus ginsenosidimutans TaxID=1007676 RepID=A0A0H4R2W7_9LACO|nr:hypothetical protein [Companilactobacillus ginsenosidimutans]AKP68105.1 hypothetical protein ABM34_11545 [Companilactobacillus ginsenosidimutans]
MKLKKTKLFFIALLSFLTFVSISSSTNLSNSNSPDIVQADDTTITPPNKPSSDPIKFLFVYWTSGFTLQPVNQYTYIGQPITLSTDTHITLLDAISSVYSYKYQWYHSTDGSTWDQPSSMTNKNVTVDPTEVGTEYFQQSYTRGRLLWGGRSGYYSKLAFVTTFPEPKDAIDVTVSTEDNYLFNNQENASETYAHAVPDPFDSTAKLSWSIDNTDLATIDSTTGLITANTNGVSGKLTVVGTLTNSDGGKIQGTTTVDIGGGLDDQEVDEGKTADFEVRGTFDKAPDSVTWHKVVNGKDSVISGASGLSYTTPETVYTDDGTKFYAVIKVTENDQNGSPQTNTITTNQANLKVIPNVIPKVIIKSNVYNNSYDNHNADDTEVFSVISGDELVIKGSFSDENVNTEMTHAGLKIKLPANMNPTSAKLDGEETDQYTTTRDPDDSNMNYLTFIEIDMQKNNSHTFEITVPAEDNDNLVLTTAPTVVGANAAGDDLPNIYQGNTLTINFTDDDLQLDAHDVDYGTLKYSNVGTPVKGTIDGQDSADILSVTDNRRNKDPKQILLSQDNPFTSDEGELASELRYYNPDGTYQLMSDQAAIIHKSNQGDTVGSLINDYNVGLRLFIYHGSIKYTDYKTTLLWTVKDAPA